MISVSLQTSLNTQSQALRVSGLGSARRVFEFLGKPRSLDFLVLLDHAKRTYENHKNTSPFRQKLKGDTMPILSPPTTPGHIFFLTEKIKL